MNFRNLIAYSLPAGFDINRAELELALEKHPLMPCTAAAMQSQGWVPPGAGPELLLRDAGSSACLIALGIEQKMLPASVVNRTAMEKAAELEKQQGFPLGRKQLRELKDRVADELRPRAFVKRTTLRALVDPAASLILIDCTSRKRAEDLMTVLRADLGSLPAAPLATLQSPKVTMTHWVIDGAPHKFTLQDDCELIADNAEKSAIRYVRHDLGDSRLPQLIQDGKVVTRLGLGLRDRMTFVMTEDLSFRRLRFFEKDESESKLDEEASLAILCSDMTGLVADVTEALGGIHVSE